MALRPPEMERAVWSLAWPRMSSEGELWEWRERPEVALTLLLLVTTALRLLAPRRMLLVQGEPSLKGGSWLASTVSPASMRYIKPWLSLVPLLHYCALVSLIESFTVMLYAIKNQLKAPKAPYSGHFLPFAGSLWHKGGFHARKESIIGGRRPLCKAWISLSLSW